MLQIKINSRRFCLLALLSSTLLLVSCQNDDDSDSSQTSSSSSLDSQLHALIKEHELTADPSHGRQIESIDSPLAQLGKKLFFSQSLSGDSDTACVSCHHPALGGGDALPLSIGVAAVLPKQLGPGRTHSSVAVDFDGGPTVPRNAPTTFNCALWDEVMFHDGRIESLGKTPKANGNDGLGIRTPDSPLGIADSLAGADLVAAQSRFPVTSRQEMRGFTFEADKNNEPVRNGLARRLVDQTIPNTWLPEFQQAFDSYEEASTLITFANIAKAISAYERSQVFVNTPWKHYVEGDESALSEAAKKGALLFFKPIEEGGANCVDCHKGDFFTDEQFYVLAIPQIGRGKGDGKTGDNDLGRFRETQNPADQYAFRTPSLLNVEVTGPYGHSGAYLSLEEVVRHNLNPEEAINHYDFTLNLLDSSIQHEHAEENTRAALVQLETNRANGIKSIQNVKLSDEEISDLLEFILALTDPCVKERACLAPWIADKDEVGPDFLQLNAVDKNDRPL